jgi:hypothetical protein
MAADINKPQTDNNSGFGLPKGEFKPIESTENRKWLRTTLIIAGVVLLVGTGIVFWLFKHHGGSKDFMSSTLQRHQEEDEDFKEEKLAENEKNSGSDDETLSELKELSEDLSSHKHLHNQAHGDQQGPSVMIINAPTGLYHVIIASYIDIDLATDYAKKLSKKGVHSQIITPTHGKHFVRLSVAQATTWKEAKEKADELKPAYGEHIWVMKY